MNIKSAFLLLLFVVSSVYASGDDPVLMRVNGKEIRRSEFEYAFNKNNNNLSENGQTVEELYKKSDDALYYAKRKGKNQFIFAENEDKQ